METVFDFIKVTTQFSDMSDLIDLAIKYYRTDPQSSIIKTSSVLEIILSDVIRKENIQHFSSNMSSQIHAIQYLVPPTIVNDMNQIRMLRNDGSAHVSKGGGDKLSVYAESIFGLSRIYDILVWYINFGRKGRIDFYPFSEFLKTLNPEIDVEKVNQSEKIEVPKLYLDKDYFARLTKSGFTLERFSDEQIFSVFKLFFTTDLELHEIEDNVFGEVKNEGENVYNILMLYKKIGVTLSWRKFVQTHTKENLIEIIVDMQKQLKDSETISKYEALTELIKKVID